MFTGIIEGLGTITAIRSSGRGRQLTLDADFVLDRTRSGDSIAVNGACLTAVEIDRKRFKVDVSPETLATTILDKAKVGDRVNLERALRISDRLDGHLVSGHIDGIGTIIRKQTKGNAVIVMIEVPESLTRYTVKKGSVAVDGISLTINHCGPGVFDVNIIPHTQKLTTIGFKKAGDLVNIETDMIGKYVERFVAGKAEGDRGNQIEESSVDMQFLTKTGFI
jgi:riboflavin synthase